jgi:hypothetical protein
MSDQLAQQPRAPPSADPLEPPPEQIDEEDVERGSEQEDEEDDEVEVVQPKKKAKAQSSSRRRLVQPETVGKWSAEFKVKLRAVDSKAGERKVQCECGGIVQALKDSVVRHFGTAKHKSDLDRVRTTATLPAVFAQQAADEGKGNAVIDAAARILECFMAAGASPRLMERLCDNTDFINILAMLGNRLPARGTVIGPGFGKLVDDVEKELESRLSGLTRYSVQVDSTSLFDLTSYRALVLGTPRGPLLLDASEQADGTAEGYAAYVADLAPKPLAGKLVCFVSDNTSTMPKAARILRKRFAPKSFFVGCLMHRINLLEGRALAAFSGAENVVLSLHNFVHGAGQLHGRRAEWERAKPGSVRGVFAGGARFCITRKAAVYILANFDALKELVIATSSTSALKATLVGLMNEENRVELALFVAITEGWEQLLARSQGNTLFLSPTDRTTIETLLGNMEQVGVELKKKQSGLEEGEVLGTWDAFPLSFRSQNWLERLASDGKKEEMRLKLEKQYESFCEVALKRDKEPLLESLKLHRAVMVAYPQLLVQDETFLREVKSTVKSTSQFEKRVMSVDSFPSLLDGVDSDAVFSNFKLYIDELSSLASDPKFDGKFPPMLEYWYSKRKVWPALSSLAANTLSVVRLSNDAPERVFSITGDVLTHRRRRMSGEKRDAEVFLRFNGTRKHWALPPRDSAPPLVAAPAGSVLAPPSFAPEPQKLWYERYEEGWQALVNK